MSMMTLRRQRTMTSPEDKEKRQKRLKRNLIAKELRKDRRYLPKVHKQKTVKDLNIHTFKNIDLESLDDDEYI
jgi:hypothetical protein